MSTVKDFLKELRESPKGMELLNAAKEPANAEEAAQLYADIAEKAGISVSKETICEFLKGKEQIQKAVAAKAEENLKSALSENDLDNVAGGAEIEGKQISCKDTFMPGEWCWVSDYCSVVISSYDDLLIQPNEKDDDTYKFDYFDPGDGWVNASCADKFLYEDDIMG